jgi:hypothetical protein
VTLTLVGARTVLAERTWRTGFPFKWSDAPSRFLPAPVDVTDLLTNLFDRLSVTQDDVCEATGSLIPEVRLAAVKNLAEPAILSKVGVEDKDWQVRVAAMTRLRERGLESAQSRIKH